MSNHIIAIGDTHFPWVNRDNIRHILSDIKSDPPKAVVQLGDLYDMFAFSKFPRTLNELTPKQEWTRARGMAEHMWSEIKHAAPKASLYQLMGNHDSRPLKRILEQFPEIQALDPLKDLWRFPGVNTQSSERDELILDNIMFMHGWSTRPGVHVQHNGMNTVWAHIHRLHIASYRLGDNTLWEANAGWVGKEDTIATGYTRQKKIKSWQQGYLRIDSLGPRPIYLPNVVVV